MKNIQNNSKLVERFCKDTKIPINIFIEPYFSQRLKKLDDIMSEKNWLSQWQDFCAMLEDFNTEQEYFEYYNEIKDTAITAIKSSPGFQKFNEEDMNQYKNHIKENHQNLYKEIYNEDAIGKKFISFDLMSANFNALKHYDKSIVNDTLCWEQFISKTTGCKYNHILNSKYIRQVILGNCNPGRQITYTGWLAEQALKIIKEMMPEMKLVNFTTDELIFEDPNFIQLDYYDEICHQIECKVGIPIRWDIFSLRKIEGDLSGYLKDSYCEGKVVETNYKGINGDFAFLTIWLLDGYEETPIDPLLEDFGSYFIFNYNGHLAKLLDIPKFSIKEEK